MPTDRARYLSGLYSDASVAWQASIAPAPNPLKKRNTTNSGSELACAVNRMDTATSNRLIIIILRRPIMSDSGASTIAPIIIPARAKLKIQPILSADSDRSCPTVLATTAIAVISKPSSILNNRHSTITNTCCILTWPLSIIRATKCSVLSTLFIVFIPVA